MRHSTRHPPQHHKRTAGAMVATFPSFTTLFSFTKTQNLLAKSHTVLRFSTCARRKLRCSSDMLQNTAGSGRCEHALFSPQDVFSLTASKTDNRLHNLHAVQRFYTSADKIYLLSVLSGAVRCCPVLSGAVGRCRCCRRCREAPVPGGTPYYYY